MACGLLLLLLAGPGASVELRAEGLALTDAARLAVELRSVDGRSHRVRLTAGAEHGLRLEPGDELLVPADGAPQRVERWLFRGGAERGRRHELRLVALEERAAVGRLAPELAGALAIGVDVRPDPAWLPRLRGPLLLAGAGLLLAALAAEAWRALGTRP